MRTRPRLQSHLPNPCPVIGCVSLRKEGQVMCRACWRLVSPEARAAFNATWRDVQRAAKGGSVTERRFALIEYKRATLAVTEAAGVELVRASTPSNRKAAAARATILAGATS